MERSGEQSVLTAEQLRELAKTAQTNKPEEKKEKKEEFPETRIRLQVGFLERGVKEAAEKGFSQYSVRYNKRDKATGELIHSKAFMRAVGIAFKQKHPELMVIQDMGFPKLIICWGDDNEV